MIGQGARRHGKIRPPVETDDLARQVAQVVQQVRTAVGEEDPRNPEIADGLEQPPRRPQRPPSRVLGAESADPRVEDLHRLSAVRHLIPKIHRHGVGDAVDKPVERLRVVVGERLGAGEGLRGRPLHQISGEGPRRTAKTDERGPRTELNPNPFEGLTQKLGAPPRIGKPQPIEIARLSNRVRDMGRGAETELDSGRHQRRQDVGEDDRRVEAEPADRLQGYFSRNLRGATHGQEVSGLLSDLAILGKIPPRLPHHPYRRPVHRFSRTRLEKAIHLRHCVVSNSPSGILNFEFSILNWHRTGPPTPRKKGVNIRDI